MQPSTPHTNKRRNWILPALFAAMLFLGGLASDLLANNIGDKLKPYSVWLWLAFAVALIVAIIAAIREQLRSNAPTTDNNTPQPTKPPGDVVARDKHEIHYHYPTTSAANSLHQLPAPPQRSRFSRRSKPPLGRGCAGNWPNGAGSESARQEVQRRS